jgi:hypothetical protein
MSRVIIDGVRNRIEHWGVGTVLTPPWRVNDVRPVVFKPPYRDPRTGHYCTPQSQSILLSSNITAGDQTGSNYAFRWQLKVGGGGGSSVVKFDALNTQQISIAGENINIEMVCEQMNVDTKNVAFDIGPNTIVMAAAASMADGNVSSGQATYTQAFVVQVGVPLIFPIPQMATSFRIIGNDAAANTPFQAGFSVAFGINASSIAFVGTKLSQYSGDFYPLPGGARSARIDNASAVPIQGWIQWGLDL